MRRTRKWKRFTSKSIVSLREVYCLEGRDQNLPGRSGDDGGKVRSRLIEINLEGRSGCEEEEHYNSKEEHARDYDLSGKMDRPLQLQMASICFDEHRWHLGPDNVSLSFPVMAATSRLSEHPFLSLPFHPVP